MQYAIMDLIPQDSAQNIVDWSTVAVEASLSDAISAAKHNQVIVPYDDNRWHAADMVWRRRHMDADHILMGYDSSVSHTPPR